MEKENIVIMSYKHENSKPTYILETLGEEFEINIPPENVLMAVCAHHQARKLIDEDIEASILTVGGCAESNRKILEKINELTESNVPVIVDTESNSVASNIESLNNYESPFIIICQKFAQLRTYIHSKYHLGEGNFKIKNWEEYVDMNEFDKFEKALIEELRDLNHIPIQRKLVEGVLTIFAYLDPKDGFTKKIAMLRQKLRKENPEENIFNKTGLS